MFIVMPDVAIPLNITQCKEEINTGKKINTQPINFECLWRNIQQCRFPFYTIPTIYGQTCLPLCAKEKKNTEYQHAC